MKYRTKRDRPGGLVPPVLLSFLLLLQFKLTLLFCLFLFTASDLTFLFVLLLLQFDRLLRLDADAGYRSLFSRFTLNPLGILRGLFYNSVHSRATYRLWRILRYTLRFYPCMLRDNYIITIM